MQVMKYGYARVSTVEQNMDLQIDALKKAGCAEIFSDEMSGATTSRPQLDQLLEKLTEGDTLTVWKLDRLGRSLAHLIEIMTALNSQNVGFVSVSEAIDTASAGGRLIFHMMGALAEFERTLITERVNAGIAAAKARGQTFGAPCKMGQRQVEDAHEKLSNGHSKRSVASFFKVSRPTLDAALRRHPAAS